MWFGDVMFCGFLELLIVIVIVWVWLWVEILVLIFLWVLIDMVNVVLWCDEFVEVINGSLSWLICLFGKVR